MGSHRPVQFREPSPKDNPATSNADSDQRPEHFQEQILALIQYEDPYVQPLILSALHSRLPPELLCLIPPSSLNQIDIDSSACRLLQWRQYEEINFDYILNMPATKLANAYIIRKALIRKHYMSATVAHWIAKRPDSVLKDHFKASVEFELDYAEFLDEALDQAEAWELRESWGRNREIEEGKLKGEREWWILKPGMSERGQGIRLFRSFEELQTIFEAWDPPESDSEDDDELAAQNGTHDLTNSNNHNARVDEGGLELNGIMTSHLRHFVAQPYIHPPLLLQPPHSSAGRKFHIRTYVVAVGALKVYVYRPMLALFAAEPYIPPGSNAVDSANEALSAHLTNTCLQSGEREGSVHDFWSLPNPPGLIPNPPFPALPRLEFGDWKDDVYNQICAATGEIFEAAARSMGIHFQPLPNAFEIFGVDFLVDASGRAWLLEINAFPDFRQTGEELRGVVQGLFEGVVEVGVKPFYGLGGGDGDGDVEAEVGMKEVLDIDLGRR